MSIRRRKDGTVQNEHHLAKALPSLARLRAMELEEASSASTLFLNLEAFDDDDDPPRAILNSQI